jgi:hypothetical protein
MIEKRTHNSSKPDSKVFTKFVIQVNPVPKWKIKAIAKYKLEKYSKSNESSTKVVRPHDSSMLSIRGISNEITKLIKEEKDLRSELNTLHTLKTSVLWLLKKGTINQTERNMIFDR